MSLIDWRIANLPRISSSFRSILGCETENYQKEVKEAQYRKLARPRPWSIARMKNLLNTVSQISHDSKSARENWNGIGGIMERAYGDSPNTKDSSDSGASSVSLGSAPHSISGELKNPNRPGKTV